MAQYKVQLKGLTSDTEYVDDAEIIEAGDERIALVVAGMDMLRALLMDNPGNTFRMDKIIDDMRYNFTVTATEI